MAVDSPRELLLFELGALHDAERRTHELLDWLSGQVQDSELAQLLSTQSRASQQQLRNLDLCFQALGATPIHIPSTTVEGMRSGFEEFSGLLPPPEIVSLFALGTARRLAHYGIAGCRNVLELAQVMDESGCIRCLQDNLTQQEENAGHLDRVGREVSRRVMATA